MNFIVWLIFCMFFSLAFLLFVYVYETIAYLLLKRI
jgi:hypothetical protein